MDGVLVDFVKGVVEQVNKDLKDSTIQSKEMIKLRKASLNMKIRCPETSRMDKKQFQKNLLITISSLNS